MLEIVSLPGLQAIRWVLKKIIIILRNMERLSENNYLNLTGDLVCGLKDFRSYSGVGGVKVFLGASTIPVNFFPLLWFTI